MLTSVADESQTVTLPELPFPMGEHLKYQIVWGVLSVGVSEATTEWVEIDGRRQIAIRIRTKTNALVSSVYPVKSFIETLVDPETLRPVRFTKISREGKHRSHEVTDFDYTTGVARHHNLRKNQHSEFPIEPETRDLLSFMYFIRGAFFSAGTEAKYRVMADEKVYDLNIKAVKQENVKTGNGKSVSSLQLEPEALFEGLFERKGRMWVWVSQTMPTVILRAEVEVPLAHIKLILDP